MKFKNDIRRGRRPQAFGSVGSGSLGGCCGVVTHPYPLPLARLGWGFRWVGSNFAAFFGGEGGGGGGGRGRGWGGPGGGSRLPLPRRPRVSDKINSISSGILDSYFSLNIYIYIYIYIYMSTYFLFIRVVLGLSANILLEAMNT